MKTSLNYISLKGFRSFVEQTTIALPKSGLVLIKGASGSGKSSLLLAISYALGYCPYPATELQSWLGDEALEVSLKLTTTGEQATLTKGPKTFLELKDGLYGVDGVRVTGVAAVTKKLTEFIGIDTELLSALTYRPQRTPGLFLSKTNAEMQDFLSVLLGLGVFDKAIEATQKNIVELTEKEVVLNNRTYNLRQEVNRWNTKEIPPLKDTTLFEQQIKTAREITNKCYDVVASTSKAIGIAKDAYQSELQKISIEIQRTIDNEPRPVEQTTSNKLEELLVVLAEINKRYVRAGEKETLRLKQAKQDHIAAVNKLSEIKQSFAERDRLQDKIDVWRKELQILSNNKCPRCEQTWKSETEIEKISTLIRDGETALMKFDKLAQEYAAQEAEVVRLSNLVVPQENEYAELRQEYIQAVASERNEIASANKLAQEQYNTRIYKLRLQLNELVIRCDAKHRDIIEVHENAAKAAEEEYNKASIVLREAEHRLREVKIENEYANKTKLSILNELNIVQKEYEAVNGSWEAIKSNISAEHDVLDMLKGFLTSIFDEVLNEIAWNTNQMLAQVPNVAHITIKFRSETTTAKGTIKKAIVPLLMIAGEERPIRSALSGGMMTAVELAVDLAVRKVISARSGVNPGWLILDECFEGLGIAEKEAAMGLLQQASRNTLIFVVDHSSEFQEMFNQVIQVNNLNGHSYIE